MDVFRPKLPDLPAEIVAMLTPAMDVVGRQARHGTDLVVGKRVEFAGKVAARANGGGGFDAGLNDILLSVFGPALIREFSGEQAPTDVEREACGTCDSDPCECCADCDDYPCTCNVCAECGNDPCDAEGNACGDCPCSC